LGEAKNAPRTFNSRRGIPKGQEWTETQSERGFGAYGGAGGEDELATYISICVYTYVVEREVRFGSERVFGCGEGRVEVCGRAAGMVVSRRWVEPVSLGELLGGGKKMDRVLLIPPEEKWAGQVERMS